MRLTIVAVGQKVPDWAQTAYDDYAKRFPPELKVELKAVKTEPRASKTLENLLSAERGRIEASIARGTRRRHRHWRARWPGRRLQAGSA
jgi:23S rRNA (pseudouridine1915-N3)-methyltransferase